MPPGEIMIACPNCKRRASVPIAAVKRDNYYCSQCFEKVPMQGVRAPDSDGTASAAPPRPKKSSRTYRR